MSIAWMNTILDRPEPVDPRQRLVLLALADRADDTGMCWPGVAWLAKRVAASERTVQRCLATLEREGWLQRRTNEGPARRADQRPSMYVLVKERGDVGVTPLAERGDTGDVNGVTPVTERGDIRVTRYISDTSVRSTRGGAEPPTLAEWMSYGLELGMDGLDAEGAWNHYEANGWRQAGGQRIRDWRAAARTCWSRARRERGGSRGGEGRAWAGKNRAENGGGAGAEVIDLKAPHAHTGGVAAVVPDEDAGPSAYEQGVAKLLGGVR
jgi:hypothetical protein